MKREAWESSSENAKRLTIGDFGIHEDVCEMARPVRFAGDRYEAAVILKEIAAKGPLVNGQGLSVTLSSDSRGKIVSSKALNTSYGQKAHFLAVANLDKLFCNSIEPWEYELNPNKNNTDLKGRRYLYAPLEFEGKIIPVKMTVREYNDEALGKRLYSVEAIDVEIKKIGPLVC